MTKKTTALALAEQLGMSESQLSLVKRTVAKGATDDELAMFLHTAKKSKLDPFLKEIWFYKDGRGNAIIFSGRDGFLKSAHESKEFRGLKSGAVHANDDFSVDMAANDVKHVINNPSERGELVAAWCTVYRKDCQPLTVYVENKIYNKGKTTWVSHPDAMLMKVAESIALKKMFGIVGVYAEEERDSIVQGNGQDNDKGDDLDYRAQLREQIKKTGIEGDDVEKTIIEKFNLKGESFDDISQEDCSKILAQLLAQKNQPGNGKSKKSDKEKEDGGTTK